MNTGLFLHRLILGNCGSGGTTAINLSVGSPAVAVNHSVLEQDPKPQIAEADERVDVWRGGTKEPEESYRKSNNKLIFSKRAKPVCVGGSGVPCLLPYITPTTEIWVKDVFEVTVGDGNDLSGIPQTEITSR